MYCIASRMRCASAAGPTPARTAAAARCAAGRKRISSATSGASSLRSSGSAIGRSSRSSASRDAGGRSASRNAGTDSARRRPARLGQRQQRARDALGPEAETSPRYGPLARRLDDRALVLGVARDHQQARGSTVSSSAPKRMRFVALQDDPQRDAERGRLHVGAAAPRTGTGRDRETAAACDPPRSRARGPARRHPLERMPLRRRIERADGRDRARHGRQAYGRRRRAAPRRPASRNRQDFRRHGRTPRRAAETERSSAAPAVRRRARFRTSLFASPRRERHPRENEMEKSFAGQVALVTRRQQRASAPAVALQLAQAGAKVVITGRHEETLRASAARHPGLTYVVADVARAGDVARSLEEVRTRFGRLDVLINNAGMLEIVPLADASPEHVRRTWETNVLGLIETTRAALPLLRKSKGTIVNLADDDRRPALRQHVGLLREQGGRPRPDALVGAGAGRPTASASTPSAPAPSRRRCSRPRSWGSARPALEQLGASVLGQVPLKRFGKPEEVAQVIAFLASPAPATSPARSTRSAAASRRNARRRRATTWTRTAGSDRLAPRSRRRSTAPGRAPASRRRDERRRIRSQARRPERC